MAHFGFAATAPPSDKMENENDSDIERMDSSSTNTNRKQSESKPVSFRWKEQYRDSMVSLCIHEDVMTILPPFRAQKFQNVLLKLISKSDDFGDLTSERIANEFYKIKRHVMRLEMEGKSVEISKSSEKKMLSYIKKLDLVDETVHSHDKMSLVLFIVTPIMLPLQSWWHVSIRSP